MGANINGLSLASRTQSLLIIIVNKYLAPSEHCATVYPVKGSTASTHAQSQKLTALQESLVERYMYRLVDNRFRAMIPPYETFS